MKPFLVTIAEQLVEKHPTNLRNVIIVVPGKRAGLFLRKHLAKILGKSFFAPKILTLPDFISLLSNKSTTSRLELIILLYEDLFKSSAQKICTASTIAAESFFK